MLETTATFEYYNSPTAFFMNTHTEPSPFPWGALLLFYFPHPHSLIILPSIRLSLRPHIISRWVSVAACVSSLRVRVISFSTARRLIRRVHNGLASSLDIQRSTGYELTRPHPWKIIEGSYAKSLRHPFPSHSYMYPLSNVHR